MCMKYKNYIKNFYKGILVNVFYGFDIDNKLNLNFVWSCVNFECFIGGRCRWFVF